MQFKKREFEFLLICNILSLLQGLFYLWYGFRLGFSIYVYLMAGFDFLFLPIWLKHGLMTLTEKKIKLSNMPFVSF